MICVQWALFAGKESAAGWWKNSVRGKAVKQTQQAQAPRRVPRAEVSQTEVPGVEAPEAEG